MLANIDRELDDEESQLNKFPLSWALFNTAPEFYGFCVCVTRIEERKRKGLAFDCISGLAVQLCCAVWTHSTKFPSQFHSRPLCPFRSHLSDDE
jgi:hypothetical protein